MQQLQIKIDKEVLIYNTPDDKVRVEVLVQDESLWLRQDKIAELFSTSRNNVTTHLKKIFASGELCEKSNVTKIDIANSDKPVKFYNLDAIIAVGYRVNSHRATMFRIWATERLREYIIKGFVMDDEHSVLGDKGSVSAELAKEHAENQFAIYNIEQLCNYKSDFDDLLGGVT